MVLHHLVARCEVKFGCVDFFCTAHFFGFNVFYFFFSSRRRHTRYWRDWSSDVCSSDLGVERIVPVAGHEKRRDRDDREPERRGGKHQHDIQIGRASCRERV